MQSDGHLVLLEDFPFAKPLVDHRFCPFPGEIGSRMVRGWAHDRKTLHKKAVFRFFRFPNHCFSER